MKYFPHLYRLNAENRFMIWISNEKSLVLADAEGSVLTFADLASVQAYADSTHICLESEEPELQDLDLVLAWTIAPHTPVDCSSVLNAWNLFGDVAKSVRTRGRLFQKLDRRIDSQHPGLYKKVFRGNNLVSLTPDGVHYVPEWLPEELAALVELLSVGLELLKPCVSRYPGTS